MKYLCFILSLLVCPVRAEVFTLVQFGDVHSDFGFVTQQQYATNVVPWILQHTNDGTLNIRGAILAGDCFESTKNPLPTNDSPAGIYHTYQLTNNLNTLATNGLLTFVAPGNHDCDHTNATDDYCIGPATNFFNTIFPPPLFTNQAYYVTSCVAGDNKMMVMKRTIGNIKLLIVSGTPIPGTNGPSDYLARYANSTAWISNQIASNPDYNAIVVDHYMLNTNGVPSVDIGVTSGYTYSYPGDARLLQGLLNLPNLFLFVSGHNRAYMKGCWRTNGVDGHRVYVTTFNTQAQGSSRNMDYVNLFTFDTARSTMRNRTYCISTGLYLSDYDVANDQFGSLISQPQGFEHNPPELPLPARPPVYLMRR